MAAYIFFFNDTATTEIYTLSLHDALPIFRHGGGAGRGVGRVQAAVQRALADRPSWLPHAQPGAQRAASRSEEHTSELQSQSNLVCRLLLVKNKQYKHD